MSFAVNYHEWILQTFEPHLGQCVVEVGAGTGSFSEMLLTRNMQKLALVEPSQEMFSRLRENILAINTAVEVSLYQGTFATIAKDVSSHHPDSIIYVNVLEHVEDDERELKLIYETLETKGRLFVFVPAMEFLYGSLDAEIGHFRRYQKRDLVEKIQRAGFSTLLCRYFDIVGVTPWWINYRLLKSKKMSPSVVSFYDRYVVPPARKIESLVRLPVGKNLILVAQKT